jgi:N-acyl-D-aspartate/D-glutamate deacylase
VASGRAQVPVQAVSFAQTDALRMLENTEQIQYEPMRRALSWSWETFPEFMAHLKSQPKGVNIASLVPVNPFVSVIRH